MKINNIFATCFYLGKLPIFPGTWASLATLLFWFYLPLNIIIQIIIIMIIFVIGLITSNNVCKELKKDDPSEVVIDEVVGMGLSLFMLPHNFILYVLAFCLFRFFDIFKPSFIFHIQELPYGWGIMLDDVIAGIVTLIILIGFSTIL